MIAGVLGFLVAFGLAVFVHELGHFLAAKAFKVPVERFVIGFDKEAMGFLPRCIIEKKWGETVYGLSLVPLGGYVKMSGVVHPDIERYLEGDGKNAETPAPSAAPATTNMRPDGVAIPRAEGSTLQEQAMQDMAALYKKPFWQKVIIYSAGVIMNLILAMLVITLMWTKGFRSDGPARLEVPTILADSTYASGPFVRGERLLSLNGTAVSTDEELAKALSELMGGKRLGVDLEALNLALTMKGKDGNERPIDLTITNDTQLRDFFNAMTFAVAYVDFLVPNGPAAKGGMKRGDTILAVNGEPINDWHHFRQVVMASPNQQLTIQVRRGDRTVDVKVTPWEDAERPGVGQIGIVAGNPEKVVMRESFFVALSNSPARIYAFTRNYVSSLGKLGMKAATGNVTAVSREVSGPAGIAQVAYKMAQYGLDDWLRFVILLNVALAVMNILPFPVLDGGHIVFAAYEGIFRRPVPPKILVPLLNGAVVAILIFVVLVTFNDFRKIFF